MEQEPDYGMNEQLSFEERIAAIFDPLDTNGILAEEVFTFAKDIDMIWGIMKEFLQHYKESPSDIYQGARSGANFITTISSADLQSKICKQAHKIKPVDIKIGLHVKGNSYDPVAKLITISVNKNAINYLGELGLAALPKVAETYPEMYLEFEVDSIKGSIAHEISHWLRDTLHNDMIVKQLNRYNDSLTKGKPKYTPIEWIYTTHHEIDANIHAISLLHKNHKKQWDELTTYQMLKLKPSLFHMYKQIASKATEKQYNAFIKRFFGRLSREGLLGKKMRPIPLEQIR